MLKVKKLHINAQIPKRATEGSAGYDLCARLDSAVIIKKGCIEKIPTGIAVALQNGTAGFIFGRSGLGIKHGISPANAVGVIDSDYRGEIIVGLINNGSEDFTINDGERIAQLIVMPIQTPEIELVEELESTERGSGGFGSTGK